MEGGKEMIRIAIVWALGTLLAPVHGQSKKYGPGVTDTEIKIGQTAPYSGPASAYASCGTVHTRFFQSLNEKGGSTGARSR